MASSLDRAELRDWMRSLDAVAHHGGTSAVGELMDRLAARASSAHGGARRSAPTTPYVNTIGVDEQPPYPGDLELERRIRNLVRYNAMAMVVRANREHPGLGGHISTFASCATLFEVALHHILRAEDVVYFQGHASPGLYARAFVEGRLEAEALAHFRRETGGRGLSSYPHPWLMPDFWSYPTVSMGLGPLMAVYQARLQRYLTQRGLVEAPRRVWCFLGDGECDEPESLAGAALAGREGLGHLTYVVSCNLQRLDGPVRGNRKLVQELEARFVACGWQVIKVLWGSDWDPLLARDEEGLLVERMNRCVDGELQRYLVVDGATIRDEFFGTDERVAALVRHLSDEELTKLGRGGHDARKVFAAYRRAEESERPTVILAQTVKGYGLGEAGEGRNVTHQQKKLNDDELLEFRSRFGIPLSDEDVEATTFYRPEEDAPERHYMRERRHALGGAIPHRSSRSGAIEVSSGALDEAMEELRAGSGDRAASTTMAFVRLLARLLKTSDLGPRIVPIVADEARTFGMDALFRTIGIYAPDGQRYTPVDQGALSEYREAPDGQLLQEGITEAGALASFIAAGTAHASTGVPLLPVFAFYSMFGFQRVGDLIWAAADARARGFLIGATAGRTTLNGEGLQHQDGHSPLLASAVPTVRTFDPATAYELAEIVRFGLERMVRDDAPEIFYITVYNEGLPMPPEPEGVRDSIRRGMSVFDGPDDPEVELLASGPIVFEAQRARELLAERDVRARVWSVTSWTELRRDAIARERRQRLGLEGEDESFLERCLHDVPTVLASDWVRLVPEQVARFVPGPVTVLGTDGFGRSDTRPALRRHFEVDAVHIAHAAARASRPDDDVLHRDLARELNLERPDPAFA